MADVNSRLAGLSAEKRALLARRLQQAGSSAAKSAAGAEPLAIVGVGCRFPGGADTPEKFWRLVVDGVDAISEIPADRWNVDELYDPDPAARGKTATRWGGFVDGVDRFDAALFGIAPREAMQMDPQQRLLLETTWDALEHAGQSPDRLKGSNTGVFVGVHSHSADYCFMQFSDADRVDSFSASGSAHNFFSGRLSYLFDLRGPSVVVDTACSSSLVAVHLAIQSVRAGECDVAIAAGVNLMLLPLVTIAASRMHMMAPDGRCKTFDASADGFVRSEGCGVVVIKRLADAVAGGDRILAVVRGTAVNQDGRTNGITAPNGRSQEAVIRDALKNGGVDPSQVSYVEAHGTGTSLGDPIEVEALGAALGRQRTNASPVTLGAVKANIGHLEGAAGIAGLIKAVLCLHHRQLPPLVHFRQLNPHITLDGMPLVFPTSNTPWESPDGRRFAGVSSFGWSGTNAHVVLEEAPDAAVAEPDVATARPLILPLSARTPEALDALARAWRDWCDGPGANVHAADVCDAAARRRAHHEYRAALVGATVPELRDRLLALVGGESHPDVVLGRPAERSGIVFVFPGQGSQWLGMGRELYETEPAFRAAIDALETALSRHVAWSLVEQLQAGESTSRLQDIDVVQPVLFAIEVALAALWRAWGVQPDAVVGHSMGEVAAAHVAGAISIEDAARVICLRSQLLRRVSGRGAMAAIELSMAETAEAIAGYEGRLSIAVSNSPTSTVISGDGQAIDEVLAVLDERDIFCRRIKVDVASHSPQMDPLRADLLAALEGMQPHASAVPMYSTVTASIADGAQLSAEYWVRNLREPVLMSKAVERLATDGQTTFIEMSPHPILLPSIETSLRALNCTGIAMPSLRRQEKERGVMLGSAARLYAEGYEIDWTAVNGRGRFADVPRYQFQRERYWLEAPGAAGAQGPSTTGRGTHPIVGTSLSVADHPGSRLWQFAVSPQRLRYLLDHRIDGTPLLPASVSLEIMLACCEELFGDVPVTIRDLELLRPLVMSEEAAPVLQVSADPDRDGRMVLKVFSVGEGDVRGLFRATVGPLAIDGDVPVQPAESAGRQMSGAEFYRGLEHRAITIGDTLRSVVSVAVTGTGASAEVTVPSDAVRDVERYRVAPALSDGLLQLTAAAAGDQAGLFLPSRCRAIRWYRRPTAKAAAYVERVADARTQPGDLEDQNLRLFDASGALVLELLGLELRAFGRAGQSRMPERVADWIYEVDWQEAAVDPHHTVKHPSKQDTWVVFADRGGVGSGIAEWLTGKGQQAAVVDAGDTRGIDTILDSILGQGRRSCRGVIFARALDAPEPANSAALDVAFRASAIEPLLLTQALARCDWAQIPRVWYVTRGAQAVGGHATSPWQAPLLGFGRVVAEEYHELFGGLIELDPEASLDESVGDLGAAIWDADREPEVAYRDRRRFVPRLARRSVPASGSTEIRRDGTYVVSGAFGAVGFAVAQWLVEQGARRLVLVGRTSMPPRDAWAAVDPESAVGRRVHAIRALEAAGAAVHVASLHVEDETAVSAFFDAFEGDGWPPVRGVVHCAALIEPGLIARATPASVVETLRAKATGAFVLDRRLSAGPLDFVVQFSSIASLLPQAGQASYAAANAFLDAFASSRRAAGRPMLSVNWGVWRGRAIAAAESIRQGADDYEASGIGSFDPSDGLDALRRLLSQPASNAVVMPADWARYHAARGAAHSPLVSRLVAESQQAADPSQARSMSFRDELHAAVPDDRRTLLEAHLQEHLARVLRLPISRIDPTTPLGSLGLESMMSLEFRNRLEGSLGLKLSATLVWNHPTVRALATYLAGRLDLEIDRPPAAVSEAAFDAQGPNAVEIMELSEEDALRALMGES